MKLTRLITLLAILVAVFLTGCSDDKKSDPAPTGPTAPTTSTVAAADQAAVGDEVAGIVGGNISEIGDMSSAISSGYISGGPKTPPTGWTLQPDNWYLYNGSIVYWLGIYKVKFTPDIWASGPPYADPTQFEYDYNYTYDSTSNGVQTKMVLLLTGLSKYKNNNPLSNLIEGWHKNSLDYSFTMTGQQNMGYSIKYLWECIFDDVSTENDQGHFTFKSVFPYVSEAGVTAQNPFPILYTDITGEVKMDADGNGALDATTHLLGTASSNGTVFMKLYWYNGQGYYTLLKDNFVTHYPWDGKKKSLKK